MRLGRGFKAKSIDRTQLEKHDLLGKGILHFVNNLCVLVDEKRDELPEAEWESLNYTLHSLMLRYEDGELYEHLLHTYGISAINYNTWTHFTIDPDWDICLKAFIDMPTEILEEYASRNSIPPRHTEDNRAIMDAIRRRADIYGEKSLPSEMVEGILFNRYR